MAELLGPDVALQKLVPLFFVFFSLLLEDNTIDENNQRNDNFFLFFFPFLFILFFLFVVDMAELLGPDVALQKLVPSLKDLVTDNCQYTRGECLNEE